MPRSTAAAPPAYDVHPSVAMVQKWAVELPAKTGRSLDAWAALIRKRKGTAAEAKAYVDAHLVPSAWTDWVEGLLHTK